MNFAEKYQREAIQFPSRNIDPKLKLLKDFGIKMCQAIYSSYVGDKASFPYSLLSYYNEVRQYSDGRQDPSKYEERLNPTESANGNIVTSSFDGDWTSKQSKRKGLGNLNREILSLGPRIMQAILGAFKDVDYNLIADTIDPDSGYEQEMSKSALYAESQHLDFLNMMKQGAGIPVNTDTKYPKDLDELQLMEDLGEFKTGISKALEKLLKHTYEISDWENTKDKLIKDIVNFNAICLHDYYDEEECKWKTEYVDITRVIAQYSDKRDYSDSCYYAVVREKTVSEIRHKLEGLDYSEEQLSQLAQNWSGQLGNPVQSEWNSFAQKDNYGNWLYDFFKCLVLEAEWIDSDIDYKTVNVSRRGIRTIYDQDFGKIRNTDHNKTRTTTIKRKYEAKWILGSDLIYDHQISPSQPRDKSNKRPLMSFHIYNGTELAITQRLIPIFDHFQITWLKLQEALVESFGEILLLDQTVLDRIKMGGETWDTLKLLKHAKRTHVLPFRSLPMNGKYGGGAVKPIDIIPSTIMNRIDESIKLFENCIRMIEMITGINPVSLGSQPNNEAGKATTEMALQNTTKILRPIIDAIFQVKEDSAEFLSEALRLGLRNDKDCREAYMKVVGRNDVEALVKSEYEARELGIKLIPRPNTEELQSLYRDIETASMPGKDGRPLIRFDVKLYIKEKLMHGANLSDIRLYLSNAIDKEIDRQEKSAKENSQNQGQVLQQQEQIKAQGEAQKIQLETQAKIAISNNEHQNDMELESHKQFHEKYIKGQENEMKQQELNQKQDAGQQPTTA